MENIPTIVDALALLAQGAGTGFVLSFLFENVKQFHDLPAGLKSQIVFAVSVLLPLVATLVLQLVPAETWVVLEPYWRALAVGFMAWAGSQATHKWNKS